MKELSAIAIQYGAYTALNLDGGGSTTMVMEDANGRSAGSELAYRQLHSLVVNVRLQII